MDETKYIDKQVFLEQLRYIREVVLKNQYTDRDAQKLKDVNWFINLIESYPKCDFGME